MPESPYHRFYKELFCDERYAGLSALATVLDISDAEPAARAMLAVAGELQLDVLRTLLRSECAVHAKEPLATLRAQSLLTRALGQHARRVGAPWLLATFGFHVYALLSSPLAHGVLDGSPSAPVLWVVRVALRGDLTTPITGPRGCALSPLSGH